MLIVIYGKQSLSFNEVVKLEDSSITQVLITDMGAKEYRLSSEEIEKFIILLDELEMEKKMIPNISAFNTDAYIMISTTTEKRYTIKFDYERNIIGIIENSKKMKQFILEENSDLFRLVQNYI